MRQTGRKSMGGNFGGGGGVSVVQITPMVKVLLILNLAIWVGLVLFVPYIMSQFSQTAEWAAYFSRKNIFDWVGLVPSAAVMEFKLWQPFTYLFLHSPDLTHILFNMLLLWWVGSQIERTMGSKQFLRYYFACGVGAAFLYLFVVYIVDLLVGAGNVMGLPVVGASGAIFGLLLAFAIFHGEEVVYFMMIFPMRAKYFVGLLVLIEVFVISTTGLSGPVANLAHLGGIVVGFAYLLVQTRLKQRAKKRWFRKNGRNLRLVVDNDKKNNTYH